MSPLPSAPPPPFTPHRGPRGCSRSRVPAASETQPCPWEADIQEGDRPETNQTIKQDRSHGLEKQRGQEGREAGRTGLSWDQVSRRFQRAACRRRRTSGHLSRWREDMGREGGHARVPRRAQDPEPREGAGGRGPCWSRTGRASRGTSPGPEEQATSPGSHFAGSLSGWDAGGHAWQPDVQPQAPAANPGARAAGAALRASLPTRPSIPALLLTPLPGASTGLGWGHRVAGACVSWASLSISTACTPDSWPWRLPLLTRRLSRTRVHVCVSVSRVCTCTRAHPHTPVCEACGCWAWV